jgi:hypothetical protein
VNRREYFQNLVQNKHQSVGPIIHEYTNLPAHVIRAKQELAEAHFLQFKQSTERKARTT